MNSYRPSLWNSIPPVVKNLIVINFILWLAAVVAVRWGVDLNGVLGMHYWAADKFNPVQLVTYMFMHGGFSHIFFNMFALFMFGSTLEQTWGGRRFLLYYLVCGVGAGVLQQVVYTIEFQPTLHALTAVLNSGSADSLMQYQDAIGKFFKTEFLQHATLSDVVHMRQQYMDVVLNRLVTVGASGSIFGILLAFGMLFPNTELYIMFIPIPIKAKYFVIVYGLLELYLGFANRAGDSVAHFAHVGGMLFGLILILYWKKKGKLYY